MTKPSASILWHLRPTIPECSIQIDRARGYVSALARNWPTKYASRWWNRATSEEQRTRLQVLGSRRRERGTALFITVMVITVLTAVGMFSMHAASLADQASGFNRQGVQTMYVAEFAARAVAAELVGKEQHYYSLVKSGTDDCRANASLSPLLDPERPTCYKLQTSELWERVNGQFPGNVGTSDAPSLLGELSRNPLDGAFIVEMTDMARAGGPLAGEDVAADRFKFMQVLLTATGQVRPGGTEGSACNASFAATSGLSNLRAQVTFGPIF